MTLNEVAINTTVRILRINGEGSFRHRLLDMGLTKGQSIVIKSVAPLGDPIEIEVRSYSLSLRLETAKLIEVESL